MTAKPFSAVCDNNGAALIVHHATQHRLSVAEMKPFSCFGTRTAAKASVGNDPEARMISAILAIENPLSIAHLDDMHRPAIIAEMINSSDAGREIWSAAGVSNIADHSDDDAWAIIADALFAQGYDGLCYENNAEKFWMVIDPSQIICVSDMACSDNRDFADISEDELTALTLISPAFDIDGRDEEFEHLWEYLTDSGRNLPVLRRDSEGWEARWLIDWEPVGTMGLFDSTGTPRGFYMSAMAWVDPDARGAGRSSLMIAATADILGGSPLGHHQGLGMSDAGLAAHLKALRHAKGELKNDRPDFS
jgi:hypothetical protein